MSQFFTSTSGGGGGGTGTVTAFSFTDGNGFDGTVTNPSTSPNLTLATTVANFNTLIAVSGALTGVTPGTLGQVLTSNGAGAAPTYQNSGTTAYTQVTGPTTYVVTPTDDYISCNSTAGPVTIQLPNAPTVLYDRFVIKDRTGTAPTNNITLTTPGGVVTIDGITSYVFDEGYESAEVLWNGTSYEIF